MRKVILALAGVAALGLGAHTVLACCGGPSCPPLEGSVSCSPDTLWPPNHRMRDVTLDVVTNATAWQIAWVTSNEADDGLGDGDTANDIQIAANRRSVSLRAERAGNGSGRTYTIVVRFTDPCGSVLYSSCTVDVPHNR